MMADLHNPACLASCLSWCFAGPLMGLLRLRPNGITNNWLITNQLSHFGQCRSRLKKLTVVWNYWQWIHFFRTWNDSFQSKRIEMNMSKTNEFKNDSFLNSFEFNDSDMTLSDWCWFKPVLKMGEKVSRSLIWVLHEGKLPTVGMVQPCSK